MNTTTTTCDTDVTTDVATGRIVAVYVRVRGGKVVRTLEVVPGRVVADLDAGGGVVGIELLGTFGEVSDAEP